MTMGIFLRQKYFWGEYVYHWHTKLIVLPDTKKMYLTDIHNSDHPHIPLILSHGYSTLMLANNGLFGAF